MEKKLWSNAELVELGVESTQCDQDLVGDAVGIDGEKHVYKCPYCKNRYWTEKGREDHIVKCHPEHRQPGSMLPGEGPDTIVPTFS